MAFWKRTKPTLSEMISEHDAIVEVINQTHAISISERQRLIKLKRLIKEAQQTPDTQER